MIGGLANRCSGHASPPVASPSRLWRWCGVQRVSMGFPVFAIDQAHIVGHFAACVLEVPRVDDVVTLKHRPGFMPADGHGGFFRYPDTNEIAHAGSAQIMKNQPLIPALCPGFRCGGAPGADRKSTR